MVQKNKGVVMWEKIKLVNSAVFSFVLPFLRLLLQKSGPILVAAATQAVLVVAANASGATNQEKRNLAFEAIANDLRNKGIVVGTDVAISVVNAAIELAVVKSKQ